MYEIWGENGFSEEWERPAQTNEETKHEDIILKNLVLTIMARHNVI